MGQCAGLVRLFTDRLSSKELWAQDP